MKLEELVELYDLFIYARDSEAAADITKYKWLAQDGDGTIYLYDHVPVLVLSDTGGFWFTNGGCSWFVTDGEACDYEIAEDQAHLVVCIDDFSFDAKMESLVSRIEVAKQKLQKAQDEYDSLVCEMVALRVTELTNR